MQKKWIARILSGLLLLIFGCNFAPEKSPKSLSLSVEKDPISFDPRKVRDFEGMALLKMLFEGLMRLTTDGRVEPGIAERVEVSEDGCTYTFWLKETFWSDGSCLTAEDFASSWRKVLDPTFPSDLSYHLFVLKNGKLAKEGKCSLAEIGVQAIGPLTLKVTLERLTPYFLELLTLPCFSPTPCGLSMVDSFDPKAWIGNGPYVLKEWKHLDSFRFLKNSFYAEKEKVMMEEIRFFIAPPDTALKLFDEGKLALVGSPFSSLPIEAVQECRQKGVLKTSPFCATLFFRVNTEKEFGQRFNPVSDAALRRALSYTVNRDEIVKHILQGCGRVATRLVPPELSWEPFNQKFQEEQKTFESKEGLKLMLSYTQSQRNQAIAQAVKESWKKALNIDLELEALEPKMFFQKIARKDYQLAIGSWTADFPDPINFLEVFKYSESSTNNTGWENIDYQQFLDKSSNCQDRQERFFLLRQAEELLLKEMPIIPIYHLCLNYVEQNGLSGAAMSFLGHMDLCDVHIEEKKEIR